MNGVVARHSARLAVASDHDGASRPVGVPFRGGGSGLVGVPFRGGGSGLVGVPFHGGGSGLVRVPFHGGACRRVAAPDRGGASLLVAALGLLFVAAGMAGAAVIDSAAAHRRVHIAADLGALAGAPLAPRGEAIACARAAQLVEANGARLSACATDGLTLLVRVDLDVEPWPDLRLTTHAEARAGPATAPASPDDAPAGPATAPAGPDDAPAGRPPLLPARPPLPPARTTHPPAGHRSCRPGHRSCRPGHRSRRPGRRTRRPGRRTRRPGHRSCRPGPTRRSPVPARRICRWRFRRIERTTCPTPHDPRVHHRNRSSGVGGG
ncbi:Rv3654c family TadE-like protein [Catenuloplanes atrovinosus]|uniref:Secretion/DNA translocation related TadE-like protein n=1 Tax=Catenuloplanes atrovinosus TaxID=137266 RepID=A0AAE3YTM7_9ACTN|nr:Rv3654c family TadE-like protein [Catenuloplanes atrovinosus]MDR7279664.1 secretion/DNA translocation related TadE-like protein [Catenuloplanes atrovinosus]